MRNLLKGVTFGVAGLGTVMAITFTGQQDLQTIEQRATEYATKTEEVIELVNSQKSELNGAYAIINSLETQLDGAMKDLEQSRITNTDLYNQLQSANQTVDDLIAENKLLRELLDGKAEVDQKEETNQANTQIQQANEAVAQTKEVVEEVLNMEVFNNVQ